MQLLDEENEEKFMEFSLESSDNFPENVRSELPFEVDWNEQKNGGRILFKEIESELPHFLAFLKKQQLRLKNLECRRRTLDDVFISLTGRRLND